MSRCNNWPAKLNLFIEEKRNQPFDWSQNNCAFFAADWVAILTGADLASDFRESITCAKDAVKLLRRENGLVPIAEKAFARWNWPEISVTYAQRGDVVTTETRHGPALGVFLGNCGAFAGPHGVQFLPTSNLTRAWRIE